LGIKIMAIAKGRVDGATIKEKKKFLGEDCQDQN
jgi:hypothetical protein